MNYLKYFQSSLPGMLYKEKKLFLYYSIPCALYAVYNNLSFYAVSHSDATTYAIILQSKSIAIALIYQILFKRKLSQEQWGSLLILTAGCMVKQFSFANGFGLVWTSAIPLIFIQIACSCFATVRKS